MSDTHQSRNGEAQELSDWLDAILKREPTSNDVLDMTLPKLQALHAYANCATAASVAVSETGAMLPLHDVYDAIKSMDRDQLLDWIEAKRLEAK